MSKINGQKGFTVIELLVASAVFSTVLLVSASGIIYVGNMFHKGITSGLTQEVARTTIDEVKDDFELSGGYFARAANNGANRGFCIGSRLYSYQIGRKVNRDGTGNAMVVREYPSCDVTPGVMADNVADPAGSPDPARPWKEFLGPNMRLFSFTVTESPTPTRPTGLAVTINVISGEDDLITGGLCNGGGGSQFCANSPLATYGVRRLR